MRAGESVRECELDHLARHGQLVEEEQTRPVVDRRWMVRARPALVVGAGAVHSWTFARAAATVALAAAFPVLIVLATRL